MTEAAATTSDRKGDAPDRVRRAPRVYVRTLTIFAELRYNISCGRGRFAGRFSRLRREVRLMSLYQVLHLALSLAQMIINLAKGMGRPNRSK